MDFIAKPLRTHSEAIMNPQGYDEYEGIEINGRRLFINKEGNIYCLSSVAIKNPLQGLSNENNYRLIPNIVNKKNKYSRVKCGGKYFYRHRIMGYAFLGLDLLNPKTQIDHIDGNRENNNVSNLRIVSNQQNHFNRVNAKGYYYIEKNNKWCARIVLNSKQIYLGIFKTEKQAREAYITAKLIFHKII